MRLPPVRLTDTLPHRFFALEPLSCRSPLIEVIRPSRCDAAAQHTGYRSRALEKTAESGANPSIKDARNAAPEFADVSPGHSVQRPRHGRAGSCRLSMPPGTLSSSSCTTLGRKKPRGNWGEHEIWNTSVLHHLAFIVSLPKGELVQRSWDFMTSSPGGFSLISCCRAEDGSSGWGGIA